MHTFVLIHSPLCGPATWQPVAAQLRAQGHYAIVPRLADDERLQAPLWQQQAESIVGAMKDVPAQQPIVWVAHSGAGLRLPAYRASVLHPVAAYIFVDAGIPHDFPVHGMSQLGCIARDDAAFAAMLRDEFSRGRRFPAWTNNDLRDAIPDNAQRAQMLAELQPRGLRYFEERLPAFASWPDAPCAYLHFTAPYDAMAAYALSQCWAYRKIDAGHFHMLVDPVAVAQAIIDLQSQI